MSMHADLEPNGLPECPDGVNFLTSLLASCPQVGAARLLDRGRTLSLEFYLGRPLRTARLREFNRDLKEAHEVFADLKGIRPVQVKVHRSPTSRSISQESSSEILEEDWQDHSDSFHIVRDLASFTIEELSLLVVLVEDEFSQDLVSGEDLEEEPDEDGYQEEIMHHSLERIRHSPRGMDLIGFRDDLRVLVYPAEAGGCRQS